MEKYETITRLGHGACGAVYLVRQKDTRRLYALKKIELDEGKKTRTREFVEKEANILAKLKHPNIVAYHDSFCDGNYLHIFQDYCDGGSIDDKIKEAAKKEKHFDEQTIMNWFVPVLMGVHYIHSNKILHRDIKCENVFLTKKNEIKIGDFGISKVLDSTIDVAKTVVGTPSYLSPELCEDIPYSSKSDMWALGCLLYEMCALKTPFDAQSLISLFFKIIKAEYEPIPSMYSDSLKSLIASLLTKQPDNRPSATAVLNMPYVKKYMSVIIEESKQLVSPNKFSTNVNRSVLGIGDSPARKPSASPGLKRKREKSPLTMANGQGDNNAGSKEDAEEYSDDFDETSDEEESSRLHDREAEYEDDFEDYDPSEDVDQLISQAEEVKNDVNTDDFFADDRMLNVHRTQTSFFKRTCMDALGCQKVEDLGKLINNGTLTENDLKHQLCHSVGDSIEICHFDLNELPHG